MQGAGHWRWQQQQARQQWRKVSSSSNKQQPSRKPLTVNGRHAGQQLQHARRRRIQERLACRGGGWGVQEGGEHLGKPFSQLGGAAHGCAGRDTPGCLWLFLDATCNPRHVQYSNQFTWVEVEQAEAIEQVGEGGGAQLVQLAPRGRRDAVQDLRAARGSAAQLVRRTGGATARAAAAVCRRVRHTCRGRKGQAGGAPAGGCAPRPAGCPACRGSRTGCPGRRPGSRAGRPGPPATAGP